MLKASAGGGGKGIRKVNTKEELAPAFESASQEAKVSFGNGAMYIEKLFTQLVILRFKFWEIAMVILFT